MHTLIDDFDDAVTSIEGLDIRQTQETGEPLYTWQLFVLSS